MFIKYFAEMINYHTRNMRHKALIKHPILPVGKSKNNSNNVILSRLTNISDITTQNQQQQCKQHNYTMWLYWLFMPECMLGRGWYV